MRPAFSQPQFRATVRRLLGVLVLACSCFAAAASSAIAATEWQVDPTFGTAGSLVLPADVTVRELRSASDGGYWGLGYNDDGFTQNPMVVKVSANGFADATFGAAGFAIEPVVEGSATDIVELADGDLLVAIGSLGGMKTWRLAPDGTPRASWGTAGVLTVGDPEYRSELLAVTPDGNVIIAGENDPGGPISYVSTARLDIVGESLDPTFGTNGVRDSDQFVSNTDGWAGPAGLLVAPDGSITVAYQHFSVYIDRYLPDGSFNTSFAGDGTYVDPTGLDPVATGFVLDAAGNVSYAHQIEAFDPEDPRGVIVKGVGGDGTAQPGYGVDGAAVREVETPDGDYLSVIGHSRLPDGSSLVTGGIWGATDNSAFTVRMTPDGTVDTTHGLDGVAAVPDAMIITNGISIGSTLVGLVDGTLTRLREVPYVAPPVTPPPAPRVRHAPECRLVGAFTVPGAAVSGTLSCSDVDGDPISYRMTSAPGHGTATVAANGAFTYQPAAGFEGTDTFGWYGTDGTFAVTTIVAIQVESTLPRVLRDTTKPVIALKVAKFKRASLLKSGVPTAVTCNEQCWVTATLVVDRKTAVRLGIPKRVPYLIGKKTAKLAKSKATRVAVPLTLKAKKSVQRSRGAVRAVLVITARDATGNISVRKLVVKL